MNNIEIYLNLFSKYQIIIKAKDSNILQDIIINTLIAMILALKELVQLKVWV